MTHSQCRQAAAHMRAHGTPFFQLIGAAWYLAGAANQTRLDEAFRPMFAYHAGIAERDAPATD